MWSQITARHNLFILITGSDGDDDVIFSHHRRCVVSSLSPYLATEFTSIGSGSRHHRRRRVISSLPSSASTSPTLVADHRHFPLVTGDDNGVYFNGCRVQRRFGHRFVLV